MQPSSFYSQMPFSSQQLLNGRIGEQDEQIEGLDLHRMMQLLHNERMAPELLPFQFSLVETILRLIKSKEEFIAQKQLSSDPDDRFNVNIYKMELERVKFIVKSYLRSRLAKIERHILYLIEKDRSELLSQAEQIFAFNLLESRKEHYKASFFNKVPRELNVLEQEPVDDRVSK